MPLPIAAAALGQSGDEPNPAELGDGVTIAVVDSGLAGARGPDNDALWGNAKPAPRSGDPSAQYYLGPAAGHGTFISDLIHQVSPGASVVNIKVAGPDGGCTERMIVDRIRRAMSLHPQIVNLSLGMYGLRLRDLADYDPDKRDDDVDTASGSGGASEDERGTVAPILLQAAIEELLAREIVVVASAGNCDSTDEMYPAAFPGVIGVAALTADRRRWDHSNFGPWVRASARGTHLCARFVKGDEDPAFETDGRPEHFIGLAEWSGTSFAAPLVAAQIAAVADLKRGVSVPAAAQQVLRGRPAPDWGCGAYVHVRLPGQQT